MVLPTSKSGHWSSQEPGVRSQLGTVNWPGSLHLSRNTPASCFLLPSGLCLQHVLWPWQVPTKTRCFMFPTLKPFAITFQWKQPLLFSGDWSLQGQLTQQLNIFIPLLEAISSYKLNIRHSYRTHNRSPSVSSHRELFGELLNFLILFLQTQLEP